VSSSTLPRFDAPEINFTRTWSVGIKTAASDVPTVPLDLVVVAKRIELRFSLADVHRGVERGDLVVT
jgi:hypothetical protein